MADTSARLNQVVNVSQVHHYSPFRYAGGKTWIVPHIRQWLTQRQRPALFIEPFCGGAIVGLTVALENLADRVLLVEIDPQVAAVWQLLIHGSEEDIAWLIRQIHSFEMTRANVDRVLATAHPAPRQQAFMTILKNRVNHGGCLAQGTGRLKEGENGRGLSSRWYPATIARRIAAIAHVRHRLDFITGDGLVSIQRYAARYDTLFFIDPPYVGAGTRLYDYWQVDHSHLFELAAGIQGDFLMSYDCNDRIQALAQQHTFDTALIHMHNKRHTTQRELLIGRDLAWAR